MQLPALLPEKLLHYNVAATDEELFHLLLKRPADLVTFFDYAADDEDWSSRHASYFRLTTSWITDQHFQERLSWDVGKLLAKIIQTHYADLSSYLPENLSIQLRDHEMQVNSLLFAASSPIFRDLVHVECFEKNKNTIAINISRAQFEVIIEFINTGTVAGLWKHSQQEIIKLLRKATTFGLLELKNLCEDTLKRYVNRDNAIEFLMRSYKNSWDILERRCCQVINDLDAGIHLDLLEQKRKYYAETNEQKPFGVEFSNFSDQALSPFHELKSIVTHIICGGVLTEQMEFSEVIQACPRLVSIDVSRSRHYSERLLEASSNLKELDLSQCGWLTDEILVDFFVNYPQLKRLALTSNTQLSFLAWSELQRLKSLTDLDLSRCNQIMDDEMNLIIKSALNISELSLEDCRRLSERAFFDIALSLRRILSLNVARCHITDAALLELTARHSQIRSLNLSRCRDLTERGMLQALKQLQHLKELWIKNCEVSETGLQRIQKLLPYCEVFH